MECNAGMDQRRLPELELRASLRLTALLAVAHGVALLLLCTLPAPLLLQGLAGLVLLASAVLTISRHALRRGSTAVCALRFKDRETLQLRRGNGLWQSGRIAGSSTVGAWLTVLNIEHRPKGMSHVVLLGDELDADDLRRLRVWLRWGPAHKGEDEV